MARGERRGWRTEAIVNKDKRRFLIGATSVVGGVGAVAAAVPFVMSFWPSERAKAAGAPIEVDISKIEPGQKIDVEWRGKVVLAHQPHAGDARVAAEARRARSPTRNPTCRSSRRTARTRRARSSRRMWIAVGICTHLGCSPTFRPELAPADLGPDWLGGFFCPCHQSKFDLAGRVFKGVPAPTNLVMPPHKYVTDTRVVIGEDAKPA